MTRFKLHIFTVMLFFFFNDPATTDIYTLSLHDALPISPLRSGWSGRTSPPPRAWFDGSARRPPPIPRRAGFCDGRTPTARAWPAGSWSWSRTDGWSSPTAGRTAGWACRPRAPPWRSTSSKRTARPSCAWCTTACLPRPCRITSGDGPTSWARCVPPCRPGEPAHHVVTRGITRQGRMLPPPAWLVAGARLGEDVVEEWTRGADHPPAGAAGHRARQRAGSPAARAQGVGAACLPAAGGPPAWPPSSGRAPVQRRRRPVGRAAVDARRAAAGPRRARTARGRPGRHHPRSWPGRRPPCRHRRAGRPLTPAGARRRAAGRHQHRGQPGVRVLVGGGAAPAGGGGRGQAARGGAVAAGIRAGGGRGGVRGAGGGPQFAGGRQPRAAGPVRSLAAAGDRAATLRQIAVCEDTLRRKLSIEPSAALRDAAATPAGSPVRLPVSCQAAVASQLEASRAAIAASAVQAGIDCLRQACADAAACADPALQGQALAALGGALVHAVRGRDEEGAAVLHEAVRLATRAGDRPTAVTAHRELGFVEVQAGRRQTAEAWLAKASMLAETDDQLAAIGGVRGMNASDMGDYPAALQHLQGSVERARRAANHRQQAWSLANLARAHLLRDERSQAAATLAGSLELVREQRWMAFLPWPQALKGELDLRAGHLDAAGDELEHAWALACQLGDPCWEGMAARGLGLLHATRGDHATATAWLAEAHLRCNRVTDRYQCKPARPRVASSERPPWRAAGIPE